MDEAERTDESADDITAADTAPRPKNAIYLKYVIKIDKKQNLRNCKL